MDHAQIRALAGDAAFGRGEAYFAQGRVSISTQDTTGFEATAQGTSRYRLWLRQEGDDLLFACSCPAAADGSFCKHLVAASLAWIQDEDDDGPAGSEDDLHADLLKQPRERLAEWLHQAAMFDAGLERQLRLKLSTDPATLKKSLSALLRTGGFLDWRRSQDYALQLLAPFDILESLLERDPDPCFELTDYVVKRLLRIYARADDSGGMIGERMRDFAELHARAAAKARVSGTKLAGILHKLKDQEDWNLFPLERYWDALGSKGQAAYIRRVDKAVAALPELTDDDDWSTEFENARVLAWREEIARCERDFDTLLDLLTRDLSSGRDYERIVKACHEFGHDALAMSWAERGLKTHPKWPGMRRLVAEEYQRAGLEAEARELLWEDFRHRPGPNTWQRLKAASADQWPAIRKQALDELAERELHLDDGRRDVSLTLQLLLDDDAPEEALELAVTQAAHPDLLTMVAKTVATQHPKAAAGLFRRAADAKLPRADAKTYRNVVPLIKHVAKLDDGQETRDWIAQIRTRYKARPKLMGMLDKAGL
jgi:uncharacterized Zn finger protein